MSVSQSVQRVLVIADLTDVTLVSENTDEDDDADEDEFLVLTLSLLCCVCGNSHKYFANIWTLQLS